ncbi:MAG: phosphoenolpyruvate carboxykinase [Hyphomicrobiaceae bacterium]
MVSALDKAVVNRNGSPAKLYEDVIQQGAGRLASSGALVVETGQHTGRSPADKFTVRDATTEPSIWWDNAKPMAPPVFALLKQDFESFGQSRKLYVQDLYAGAEPATRLKVRVYCEYAWHALFIQNLLIVPPAGELADFVPDLTIVDLPSFRADTSRHGTRTETVIAVDFESRLVLIGGTSYAGEIKKSVFTYLNYVLPDRGIMPMHCSANEGKTGDAALFFGLSGTGKTTLSADPERALIGDDEHGWSESGVYNFEGGCYAKTIRLSAKAEPEIYAAVNRFGAVLENVVVDELSRVPDFDDGSRTENTRGAYPVSFIANAKIPGVTGHPKNIIMLTADAFGVLPPIARLSPSEAMYHFLSGYTAKVAGTEKGVTEPSATFSTCFGAPFMPRHPSVYGNLLKQKIAEHQSDCWLVNTGWTGGRYGEGRRMPIAVTRGLLNAALNGTLRHAAMRRDAFFGFEVPLTVEGVDSKILDPRATWADPKAYDEQARRLVDMFAKNFSKFEGHVDADVLAAAPSLRAAAE